MTFFGIRALCYVKIVQCRRERQRLKCDMRELESFGKIGVGTYTYAGKRLAVECYGLSIELYKALAELFRWRRKPTRGE